MSRRALVTGGSGAIGAAICRRLAADGCEVLIHAHRGLEAAEALACELRSGGSVAQVLAFDVTDAEACRQALVTALAGGPVQVLVNNAGIHDDAVLAGMRAEQWHHVIDVSVDGFFHVTQPLLLPMLRTRWGRIISIGSVAGLAGNRGQVNYAAAKGALHAATRAISRTCNPKVFRPRHPSGAIDQHASLPPAHAMNAVRVWYRWLCSRPACTLA